MASEQAWFYEKSEQFISQLLEESPVMATQLGDHRFDSRLSDYSQAGLDRRRRQLGQTLAELERIPAGALQLDAQIDHQLMLNTVRMMIRGHDVLRTYARNPGEYTDECMGGVFLLLIKQFAPLPERLKAIAGRLEATPQLLEQAKQNLIPEEVPPIWAQVALESTQQGIGLYTAVLPSLARDVPGGKDFIQSSQAAAQALENYVRFLQEAVLPRAQGQFPIGETLFDEMLCEDHMVDYSAQELLATGRRLFQQTWDEMVSLAATISPDKDVKTILDEAKDDHPNAEDLLDTYRREMARARAFIAEHDVLTIPEGERLRVEPTPPFLRGIVPYAAYMMPGPLEELQEGIFLVTPVDPEAPEEEQRAQLRGHHRAKLPITAVHEAYPGHHLQLVYANGVGRLPRQLGSLISTLFIEGWAFYCEELMERLGFLGTPTQRLGRLHDGLWRCARIILDASLHTSAMTAEEAASFLVDQVGLERASAQAEVRRYTMSPTQPMSYQIGKLEIGALMEEYKGQHPSTSLRELHDAVLSCGSLPPRLMRQRLMTSRSDGDQCE
ncbi:MAG: DUF885 domain-containing protein [Candidatus Bipolaricaulota bacterium]